MEHNGLDYWTGREKCIRYFSKSLGIKEVTIEGIGQRASMDKICHKLQYMGRLLENPVENVWKIEDNDDDYIENVKKRIDMDQQEMKERSRLDRTGVG